MDWGGDADGSADLIAGTLERTPKDATHWSTRSMARGTCLSQSTVSRIWRAFGLQPHRSETFKVSADPYFVDKVHDVVGLYLDPPERSLVFCVDEKSRIQALDRSPARPADDARRPRTADRGLRPARNRHYATHKTPAVKTWLPAHSRFHLHVTPTGSSWPNPVERWSAELTNKRIRRGVHKSVQALETDIRQRTAAWNTDPKPYIWTKAADDILERPAGHLKRIPDSEDWAVPPKPALVEEGPRPSSTSAGRHAAPSGRHGRTQDPGGRKIVAVTYPRINANGAEYP